LLPLEEKNSSLLAFGEQEFISLPSKNKVADEKMLVRFGHFESFKEKKVSLWMFKISKKYSQYN
jgi:hypothetical protein